MAECPPCSADSCEFAKQNFLLFVLRNYVQIDPKPKSLIGVRAPFEFDTHIQYDLQI